MARRLVLLPVVVCVHAPICLCAGDFFDYLGDIFMRVMTTLLALLCVGAAPAQNLVVYDDALRNDFLPGYSYGGGTNLDNAAPTYNGSARSIAFTGNSSNAVAFANEARSFDTAQYTGLRFFVHGGASGGQQLRLHIYSGLGGAPVRNVELDSYISGGAIVAGQWRQVEVSFAALPLAFSGSFKRFDLQSDAAGAQPVLYLDAVELVAPAAAPVFANGFEASSELLFAPQFAMPPNPGIDLRIFSRGPTGLVPLRALDLGPDLNLNSVAFAPDGKLWALDNSGRRLLRYSRAALLEDANPVAEVVIGPIGNAGEDVFDLAFFGDFAYVSQSNFGAVNRVLKYPLASLNASGNPLPTILGNADLDTPAGLAFDAQGRLWVSNFMNDSLVRMSTVNGVVDRKYTFASLGGRGSLAAPEGLAFDSEGTLWVGNNKEATISAFSAAQIASITTAAVIPVHQIDVDPAYAGSNTIGGVAFAGNGRLWANYQQQPLTIREYTLTAGPGAASYQSTLGQVLSAATTFPGFGGIAFWPVPATVHRGMPPSAAGPAFRGTTLVGMETSYQFFDAAIGPIEGTHYPRLDERLIDYFADKGMTALRFLVCWEALQSQLMGPIPAAEVGHYRSYFDHYTRVVDYATRVKGMTVLVTPWQVGPDGGVGGVRWRGGLVGTAQVPIAAWSDFWRRLATVFADNPRVEFVLVTEPHGMPTMDWWSIAQAGIDAIRGAGATQRIHVPGNGYTAASSWTNSFYDTGPAPKRSNAYGWLNANGSGNPIRDPLNRLVAEVHTYLDADQSGSSSTITSVTAARQQLAFTVNEARERGYQVYLGEIGMLATEPLAPAAWADFIDYFEANSDVLVGFTWWAGGHPQWWSDIGANGGGHYSISPLSAITYSGDTVNMTMIQDAFR